jgi:predicted DNA-binding protein with PD1-like motif
MMNPTRHIQQPGPALEPRILAMPCRATPIRFTLQPGEILLDGLASHFAEAGYDPCPGAVVHLTGGGFGPFQYVIPALSETNEHAAFYSEIFEPDGVTSLELARVTFGVRHAMPWLHCHGFWTQADGLATGGHIIPDGAIVAEPIEAEAWVLDGAGFDTNHDLETNFTLLGPVPDEGSNTGTGRFFAMRLRPNQDWGGALVEFCATQGIARARILGGVGSIIGAVFADGRESTPFATEIFVRSGEIDTSSRIDIGLVNYLGERLEGLLTHGENPVLMTAEFVLEAIGD